MALEWLEDGLNWGYNKLADGAVRGIENYNNIQPALSTIMNINPTKHLANVAKELFMTQLKHSLICGQVMNKTFIILI